VWKWSRDASVRPVTAIRPQTVTARGDLPTPSPPERPGPTPSATGFRARLFRHRPLALRRSGARTDIRLTRPGGPSWSPEDSHTRSPCRSVPNSRWVSGRLCRVVPCLSITRLGLSTRQISRQNDRGRSPAARPPAYPRAASTALHFHIETGPEFRRFPLISTPWHPETVRTLPGQSHSPRHRGCPARHSDPSTARPCLEITRFPGHLASSCQDVTAADLQAGRIGTLQRGRHRHSEPPASRGRRWLRRLDGLKWFEAGPRPAQRFSGLQGAGSDAGGLGVYTGRQPLVGRGGVAGATPATGAGRPGALSLSPDVYSARLRAESRRGCSASTLSPEGSSTSTDARRSSASLRGASTMIGRGGGAARGTINELSSRSTGGTTISIPTTSRSGASTWPRLADQRAL
jgi:hypothetical protein